MLVEDKLTEKCIINDIPVDRNSATVHTYIHSTPLYLKNTCSLHLFLLGLNLFKHYSRTTVFYNVHTTLHFLLSLAPLHSYKFLKQTSFRSLSHKQNLLRTESHLLCTLRGQFLNLLKTKRNLLYIRNQFVPRSKHFPRRL